MTQTTLNEIVRTSKAKYDTLLSTGSVDGHTYNSDNLYLVEYDFSSFITMPQLNDVLTAANLKQIIGSFSGATTSKAGTNGLVPTPAAGANTRYLCSDGTWKNVVTTDNKVEQTGNITTNYAFELILSKSANDTTETNTVNKTSRLTYNPSTYSLKNGGCVQQYDTTNECLKFIFN